MQFVKSVASGNDFIILTEEEGRDLSAQDVVALCRPKYGISADGVLLLSFLGGNRVGMRIINSDGSEAEMCGNGARCAVRFACERLGTDYVILQTLAGDVQGWYYPDDRRAKVKLTQPKDVSRGISIECSWGRCLVDYIDTGVPHAVVFVEDIDNEDVFSKGRELRYHPYFQPRGTNVDFVKILDEDRIRVRTYERGVEDETLACGTGSVASAVLSLMRMGKRGDCKIQVLTQGGEVLEVEVRFDEDGSPVEVFLEGDVRMVFSGETKEIG